jgi:S1-C subfamily serine protease
MASAQTQRQPSPPKRGEPINIMELVRYFEAESINLLQQGRVATNLLWQPRPQACALNLMPPPERVLAGDELPQAVEMGVAVVGRLAKVGGRPQLTPTASGFFLTESGALATCWHVVNWDKIIGLTVMTRDGRVCPVRQVLAVSTNYDLAILQVEGTGFTPLPVAPNVRQGAPVWVLGHPFPWYYMLTSGIASSYYTLANGRTEVTILDITADFANGSSGAPVLNEYGAVVGVAKFRQTIGLPDSPQMATKGCLPSSVILNMTNLQPSP